MSSRKNSQPAPESAERWDVQQEAEFLVDTMLDHADVASLLPQIRASLVSVAKNGVEQFRRAPFQVATFAPVDLDNLDFATVANKCRDVNFLYKAFYDQYKPSELGNVSTMGLSISGMLVSYKDYQASKSGVLFAGQGRRLQKQHGDELIAEFNHDSEVSDKFRAQWPTMSDLVVSADTFRRANTQDEGTLFEVQQIATDVNVRRSWCDGELLQPVVDKAPFISALTVDGLDPLRVKHPDVGVKIKIVQIEHG